MSSRPVQILLLVLMIGSALAVVEVKHENRSLVSELETLRSEHEQLRVEWSQLQLEEATQASHGRIEEAARGKLGMAEPQRYVIVERGAAAPRTGDGS